MPAPRSPKEVKQFLGLAGYYCKFVPQFSDLSRPLTKLTRKVLGTMYPDLYLTINKFDHVNPSVNVNVYKCSPQGMYVQQV